MKSKLEYESDENRLSGVELLDALSAQILRYVVCERHEARAIALWIVHSHAFDLFPISPRLKIQSPEPGCGKTTLLDVLRYVVRNPMLTAHVTAAAVFHAIADKRPTLLMDEADTSLTMPELIAILNAGHRRNDAEVLRADGRYSVWAPAAFATISGVSNQLDMRSIPINLRRRRSDEDIKLFRHDRTKRLSGLQGQTAKWVRRNREALKKAKPVLPDTLHNRLADNWRPLLAIADIAGGEWPTLARRAAEALCAFEAPPQSEAVMLLSDIRDVLAVQGADRIWSSDLAMALANLEGRPWCEYKGRGPITANGIALLLASHRIRPLDIRIDRSVRKGYRVKQFDDAFVRYLGHQKA
jgi:putative DNA primase/helicase